MHTRSRYGIQACSRTPPAEWVDVGRHEQITSHEALMRVLKAVPQTLKSVSVVSVFPACAVFWTFCVGRSPARDPSARRHATLTIALVPPASKRRVQRSWPNLQQETRGSHHTVLVTSRHPPPRARVFLPTQHFPPLPSSPHLATRKKRPRRKAMPLVACAACAQSTCTFR